MKKLLVLTAILTLILAACSDGSKNRDVAGTWKGTFGEFNEGTIRLDIKAHHDAKSYEDGLWVLIFTKLDAITTYDGYWKREGDVLTLRYSSARDAGKAILSGGKLILDLTETGIKYAGVYELK